MDHLGVTVAIIEGNSILLTLREDFEVWCMPGGEVDEGEGLADAARREVREETGLEVELTRLVGLYSRVGWRHLHIALFAARVVGGTLTPDPREVLDARFFPFAPADALPEHLMMGQNYRIRDAISGATGIVRTEHVPAPDAPSLTRADLYALRDQSGLPRREFYLRNMARLAAAEIHTELEGCSDI